MRSSPRSSGCTRGSARPIRRFAGCSAGSTAAPEEPEALRALARLYDRPGHELQLAATLDALDRLLVPAEQAVNRKRIAALHASLSHHDDAERAFARALEVDPGDLATLAGRAEALRALGRTDDLIPALERLADQLRGEPLLATLRELAQIHEQRGDLAGAIAVLGRAESEDGAGAELTEQIDGLLARTQALRGARAAARAPRRRPASAAPRPSRSICAARRC